MLKKMLNKALKKTLFLRQKKRRMRRRKRFVKRRTGLGEAFYRVYTVLRLLESSPARQRGAEALSPWVPGWNLGGGKALRKFGLLTLVFLFLCNITLELLVLATSTREMSAKSSRWDTGPWHAAVHRLSTVMVVSGSEPRSPPIARLGCYPGPVYMPTSGRARVFATGT
ncbi:hypothetical protein EV122DRAFT_256330 [Schizophyllum commune]